MSTPTGDAEIPDPAQARAAVLATGPALRDPDGAAGCSCSCHPRPAQLDSHGGGVDCPCQQTPEERAAALSELFADLAALGEHDDGVAGTEEFAALCGDLGVTAAVRVPACPLILTGVVDGHAFYFRERHGHHRVAVPTGDDPLVDLYEEHQHPELTIAEGAGYVTSLEALRLSVKAVRDHLRRTRCAHPDARAFCPDCGTETTTTPTPTT